MIVVMTSWAPVRALRMPGTKPQIAPPIAPASSATTRCSPTGSGSRKPTNAAPIAPMMAWPCTPMLNRPPRNATAKARPVKANGAV